MALRGGRELRARLKAIRLAFKPLGRSWGERTVQLASSRVRVKTGRTKRSIRIKNASQRKAAVEAKYGARFLEAGAQPHTIQPKRFQALRFEAGGRPVFAKRVRHPGSPKQPFLKESAKEALGEADMLRDVIDAWNRAA